MDERSAAARYLEGAALLPPRLRGPAEGLARTDMARAEELRLRVGRPMTAVYPEGEAPVPGAEEAVTAEEVERVLEIATRASATPRRPRSSTVFSLWLAGTASACAGAP